MHPEPITCLNCADVQFLDEQKLGYIAWSIHYLCFNYIFEKNYSYSGYLVSTPPPPRREVLGTIMYSSGHRSMLFWISVGLGTGVISTRVAFHIEGAI